MKLGVLGELLVDLNGATVELRRAERRLVAGLAVERPSGVRYDALAEAVWGDRVPASAKHSLQSHVRRIRAVTGDGLVQTVAGGYRLGTDVQVDVGSFEWAIERAGAADDEAPTLWAEALSWWRGPPFVDLDDWAPAVAERARLTELWNRAVEECCAACLATSDPTTVIAEAERLVHAEPLRERRWALLMTALAAAGRRPEALRTFDRARRTLATELGISPGAELAQLHAALVRDDAETIAAVHRVVAHNLPIQLTPLIGRASEIADVLGQLVDERLVTLTGSAGVGKTRLALAAAAAVSATYSGGVWLVELAATADPADVEPLVATALRFAPGAGLSARASIIDGIGDRALLVVLDNCEHLLDAVADFAHETLRRCSRLRILATSRERLGVDGERVVRVPSLSVDSDAIELFIDRARNADASFRADPRVVVEQICQRLDGIPLAIELAAARVRTLRLPELASRLDEHLDVLTAGRHGRVERHQTLRASIDWSWGLLDDDERTAFGRLSVFARDFDMEAANAVSGGTPLGDDVVDVLAALVDKSMVLADLRHAAPFRLLEPLRQYGAEQLAAQGDTADFGDN